MIGAQASPPPPASPTQTEESEPSNLTKWSVDANHPNAHDGPEAGSEEMPFKSIGAALNRIQNLALQTDNPDLTLLQSIDVAGGVYRESLEIDMRGVDPDRLDGIVLHAKDPVIVSGADIIDVWEPATDYYLTPWPHSMAPVTFPEDIEANYARDGEPVPWLIRQREMVFLADEKRPRAVRIPQVEPAAKIGKGTFTLFPDTGQLALLPPHNYRLRPGAVRISNPERACLLSVKGVSRFGLTGPFEFRHANGVLGDRPAAVDIRDVPTVRIEGITFEHNNTYGLRIEGAEDVSIKKITAQRNGLGGLLITNSRRVTLERSVVRLNNWRGFEAGITPVGAIGASFEQVDELTIERTRFLDNKCDALNVAATQATLDELTVVNNGGHALYVFSEDASLSDNVFALNAASVNLRGSVSVQRCTFYDNGPERVAENTPVSERFAQVNLFGGGKSGEADTRSTFDLRDNIFASQNGAPQLALLEWTGPDPEGESAADALTGQRNVYFSGAAEAARFRVRDRLVDLATWRELAQADATSIETDPLLNAPQRLDFMPHPQSPVFRKSNWPVVPLETAPGVAWESL
ncbi:MAG: right-handed parallel beta-helix repeat-containing protein [Opitutales bacterium]